MCGTGVTLYRGGYDGESGRLWREFARRSCLVTDAGRRNGWGATTLAMGLADERSDAVRIADSFREYMEREGGPVTRAMFERNLEGKIDDAQFNADIGAMLSPGFEWRPEEAARSVSGRLLSLLPGEPRKGETDG